MYKTQFMFTSSYIPLNVNLGIDELWRGNTFLLRNRKISNYKKKDGFV